MEEIAFKKICSIDTRVEKVLESHWWIAIVGVWITVLHCLGLDMVGFGGLVFLCIVMCAFCTDIRPILVPMIMGFLVVSTQNSPGYTDGANYYFTPRVINTMFCLGSALITALVFNFTFYHKWKSLVVKSNVALSLCVYSVALIISALAVATHKGDNLVFVISVIASIMVVYILAKSAKKRPDNLMFLARLCGAVAFIVAIQIGWLYVLKYDFSMPIPANWKMQIVVGWGVSNIAAELIVMLLPALFYLIYYDYKWFVLYFTAVILCMVAVFFTFSRTGILFGTFITFALTIFCMLKGRGKVQIRIFALCGVTAIIAAAIVWCSTNYASYNSTIEMWLNKNGKFDMGDNGRYILWEKAMEYFKLKPIFGNGFLTNYFENNHGNSNMYMYLFHNTIFQMLGSAGLVGLIALLYSRVMSAMVFIKKPTIGKTFFGMSLLLSMGMGLLDLIMFAPYILFYFSLILAFCETDLPQKSGKSTRKHNQIL